jgi:hypothetical protein
MQLRNMREAVYLKHPQPTGNETQKKASTYTSHLSTYLTLLRDSRLNGISINTHEEPAEFS